MDPSRSQVLGQKAITQLMLEVLDVPSLRETRRVASLSVDWKVWARGRAKAGRRRSLGLKERSHDLI